MKIKLNIAFGWLWCIMSFGQSIGELVPPSPNAASLGQYADIPVSNYTGVPNITIPLYTIKSGEITLPITLSYHASGIKVAQEASWVGLGWALNAGGVITRQVRGLNDFDSNGYLRTELPPASENNLPDWSNTNRVQTYIRWYGEIASGYRDGEPDVFYYNFLGYSGKLVFEQQSETEIIGVSIDQNNLIFSYNLNRHQWTVTDGNGWKYYLGNTSLNAVEETTNYNFSSTSPINETDKLTSYDAEPKTMDSAWYLTEIMTPSGESIEFLYEDTISTSLGQISSYELLYSMTDFHTIQETGGGYISPSLSGRYELYAASQQKVADVYLKKIEFNNGFVEFTREDRDDIRAFLTNGTKPQRLKSTVLFDVSGKPIKQFDLSYSYFNNHKANSSNAEKYLRLRLDSFQEKNKPPYVFSYNTINLPEKTSYSIDHWGYYNGKNNNYIRDYFFYDVGRGSLVIYEEPYTSQSKMLAPFYENATAEKVYLSGANREVDTAKMQAAILESIQYPTGSTVNFFYEPNDYYDESNILYEYEPNYVYVSDYGPETPLEEKESSFTLDAYTLMSLSFYLFADNDYMNFNGITAVLEDENGDDIVKISQNLYINDYYFNAYLSVLLPPGSYNLKVDNGEDNYDMIEIIASYKKHIPTTKKIGAGLRIESIQTLDEDQTLKQKKYSYENDGISSGRMLSPLQYFYNETLIDESVIALPGNVIHYIYTADYLVRSSTSTVPFGNSARGSIIGYDEVVASDIDMDNRNIGVSKYYYKNEEDIPIELFMPGAINLTHLSNGQLLEEKHFNDVGNLVKEKSTHYVVDEVSKINLKAVKVYTFFGNTDAAEVRFYDIFSEWWHPESTTETLYDVDGNNPITTTQAFEYANPLHKNITKTTLINSKEETLITTKEYPSDFPIGTGMSAADYDGMILQNMVNPVIKQKTSINNELRATQVTSFKNWDLDGNGVSDNIFLPEFVKSSKGSGVLENKIEFHEYYENGKIKEVSKSHGTPVFYIWGYQENHPIAKIENFTSSQASSLQSDIDAVITASNADVDAASEDSLRDALSTLRQNLPNNTQMSSYTYDPLIGVTSITNPRGQTTYYHYDEFNRLESVTDQYGKLLSENKYNYKQ